MASEPAREYEVRLGARRGDVQRLEWSDRRLSVGRGIVGVTALFGGAVLGGGGAGIALFAGAAVVFFVLVIVHEGVARRLARARRRVGFFEAGLARVRDEWVGTGEAGARFADSGHPYANDLDLFGRGSLFERLSVARTHAGEEALAAWLLRPTTAAEARERQAAVRELGPRLDLREDMAVLGVEARRAVDSSAIARWVEAPPVALPGTLRGTAVAASAFAFAALLGWMLDLVGPVPFYWATAAVALVAWRARSVVPAALHGLGRPAQDLLTLAELLKRLEGERFQTPGLVRLVDGLKAEGKPASERVAQLRRWLEVHESKRNVFFAPVAFYLLWDVHLAAAVEGWRRRHGAAALRWLSALGELEALSGLGAYAFENPADPYPVFDEAGPVFQAEGLAHPLLPRSRSVANDVALDAALALLVVSGSNMSGKSTLLRTVGVNAVLAFAGAPVRAASLRLSPLAVGASIGVHDSLQDGESRFYAEIKRIRQVVDLAQAGRPALFLLDEIFSGTNSAERRVGAEAVVRALVDGGAIGLVTSHDLALADVADNLAPRAKNVHFEDHLEGDRIAFDYRLKPGKVTRGNALALMRAVGLRV